MSEGKRITFADIKRQMELASEDIETWPTWMRRAAGLDGEGPDYNTLRAENARLRECLRECVSCIEVLSMRGVDHDECGTVESAIREGWWCNMAIDARTHALAALQPERGKP